MKKIFIFHEKRSNALSPQKKIDQHNLPFTLNTCIGCLFECRYCYLQEPYFNKKDNFGKEVEVKLWIADKLDQELDKYKDLPPHLKRVQVNVATEGYLPQVINEMRKRFNRDLMAEVLHVFKKHWDSGNRWMVHLITKSHLVKSHLEIFKEMKDQVQLELTITTVDEQKARLLETLAPSVKKRLDVIETFAKNDVFVRVMCMPLIGDDSEALKIKDRCFDLGARAFKHKGVNYWDENALMDGMVISKGSRKDKAFEELIHKSGEYVKDGDSYKTMAMRMPDGTSRKKFSMEIRKVEDNGYREMNKYSWGYCV